MPYQLGMHGRRPHRTAGEGSLEMMTPAASDHVERARGVEAHGPLHERLQPCRGHLGHRPDQQLPVALIGQHAG